MTPSPMLLSDVTWTPSSQVRSGFPRLHGSRHMGRPNLALLRDATCSAFAILRNWKLMGSTSLTFRQPTSRSIRMPPCAASFSTCTSVPVGASPSRIGPLIKPRVSDALLNVISLRRQVRQAWRLWKRCDARGLRRPAATSPLVGAPRDARGLELENLVSERFEAFLCREQKQTSAANLMELLGHFWPSSWLAY